MIYKGLPGQFPEILSLNGNEKKDGESLVGRVLALHVCEALGPIPKAANNKIC